jgi:hypothetical protein
MGTNKITLEYRLTYWTQVIRERKESGLTVNGYCKDAGISEHSYYYWQKKLRWLACEQLAEIQSSHSQTNLDMPKFTEVKLRHSHAQLSTAGTVQPSDIRLAIGNVHITFDSSYPPHLLAALLKEMLGPC